MHSTIVLILLFLFTNVPDSGPLSVTITNIQDQTGKIHMGLFDDANKFPKDGEAFKVVTINADSTEVNHVFENIPAGVYGVAVFHDINDDGKMNTNFLGFPKEPYGFSQNFKPKFRAPKFINVQFDLKETRSIEIKLIR